MNPICVFLWDFTNWGALRTSGSIPHYMICLLPVTQICCPFLRVPPIGRWLECVSLWWERLGEWAPAGVPLVFGKLFKRCGLSSFSGIKVRLGSVGCAQRTPVCPLPPAPFPAVSPQGPDSSHQQGHHSFVPQIFTECLLCA